jgi:hypothetical protein
MLRVFSERAGTAGRFGLAAGVAVCLGLVLPAVAAAATVTIGAPDVSGNQASVGGQDTTFAQVTQPTPGALLTAPGDGVIIAWHVHGHTDPGAFLALRVLHRLVTSFTGVATSDRVTAELGDGSPAHAVSIPVHAGDYIGVDVIGGTGANAAFVYTTLPSGASVDIWGPRLADGSSGDPSASGSGRLQLNAVEAFPPAVSGVSPSSGSTAGGQAVTIRGSNLDGATAVRFGGTAAASFTVVSPTQINATTLAHTAGTVDVQVTGPGGASPASGADSYTYAAPPAAPPAIAIASPANGASYTQGQAVNAAYSCSAPAGVAVTSCSGPVADGAPIDTRTRGSHTFSVIAQDSDRGSAASSATYRVVAAGPPPPTAIPAPTLRSVSQTATTWRENDTLPHVSAKRTLPVGTTFAFALNESATVRFSFRRQASGRRVHRACLAETKTNRRQPRCRRTILAGTLTFRGHPDTNSVRFAGRLSATHKLKPGRYTLLIIATNTQGKRSSPRSLTFTIHK